jgi:peptide/nickel transport system permease protein
MNEETPRAPSGLGRLARRPLLLLGVILALAIVLLAVIGPFLAPHSPIKPLADGLSGQLPSPPSPKHLLGADSRGRDVLSRLLFGARATLTIGLGAVALATLLGLAVGASAGYFGGWTDGVLMRLTDTVMAFPAILLAIATAAVLPHRSLLTLTLIIGFINWTAAARILRSETLTLRERVYVEAATVLGAGHGRIFFRHVLPHLRPTLLVVASAGAAATILLDAGLSFLGIGLPAPAPTWGSMLQEAQQWYSVAPWLAFWPGLAVVLTVAAFNLIAFELQRGAGRRA